MFNPDPDNTTKIVDAAIKGVQVLADKLGVASGQLWDVLVSQGWLNLAKDVSVLVVLPLLAWIMWKYLWQFYFETKFVSTFSNPKGTEVTEVSSFILVPTVETFIMVLAFMSSFFGFQTPQMYAVHEILKAISK